MNRMTSLCILSVSLTAACGGGDDESAAGGLANIVRRLRDLDGRVEIGPGAKGGTRVHADFRAPGSAEAMLG